MSAKRESLEGVFGAKPKPTAGGQPQRGAALAGMRPPSRSASPQVPAPVPTPAASIPAPVAVPPAVAHFEAVPVEPQDDDAVITSMVVYIDEALLDAVRAEKGRIGGTYADVAEDALDAQLAAVAASFGGAQQDSAGGMLPRRRRATGVRGRIQLAIRFSRGQQRWLDAQADAMGAPSRSAVVALALAMHLGTHTP